MKTGSRLLSSKSSLSFFCFLALTCFGAVRLSAQALSPVSFSGVRALTTGPDGSVPKGKLLLASDGAFFGTANVGGTNNGGTLFRVAADGTFTTLRSLATADGINPVGGLVQGSDGKLYGTAAAGGASSAGTVFSMNLDGTGFVVLRSLTAATDGSGPVDLIEANDGRLYGAATNGGSSNAGTIFRLNKDGSGFTALRSLTTATDGRNPQSGVIQATDGRLYGTTSAGGTSNGGTIFRLNLDGSGFSVLRALVGTDGTAPYGRLLLASNIKLYGVTTLGGANSSGTIFRINLDGSDFTVLRSFAAADGTSVIAGLAQGVDESLYGVASAGGANTYGSLFTINPYDATFSVLWNFSVLADGSAPVAPLVQGADRKLYGSASVGGGNNGGSLFSMSLTPRLTSASSATAAVGQAFTYTLVSPDSPSAYSATGLPTGVVINTTTGVIAGTPLAAGVFPVTVGATNANGTTTATLTLTVGGNPATVALSNLSQSYDGAAKPVTVTTSPAGLNVVTTYNGLTTVPSAVGSYTVTSTVSDAAYFGSASGTLTIAVAVPRITVDPVSRSVIAGNSAIFTVSLQPSGATVTYQWQRLPLGSGTWVDVVNDTTYSGAKSDTLTVAGLAIAMNGDQFRVVTTNSAGSSTSAPAALTVFPSSRLRNFSVRANTDSNRRLVVGFVTNGLKTVLVRAVGPGLAQFLPAGSAVGGDPSLTLFNATSIQVAANDNWSGTTTLINSFASVGAFPLPTTSLDAAAVFNANGSASAQMSVTSAGLGLIEMYDLENTFAARLINISAIYQVGVGANVLVAGFVVEGTGAKNILVRGIGPGLTQFNVTNVLADPKLEVRDGAGVKLSENDNWTPNQSATFSSVGAFPLTANSKDAALTLSLQPGAYTVQLSGADGGTGTGLIEIYELP